MNFLDFIINARHTAVPCRLKIKGYAENFAGGLPIFWQKRHATEIKASGKAFYNLA